MTVNKIEILQKYTQAWNEHDIDTIMAMTANECAFYTIAGPEVHGTEHKGRDKVRAAFEAAWTNFPDAAWVDGEFYDLGGNKAMTTSTFKGTDLNGDRHEAQMVDLFVFDGDKIATKNAFRKNRPAIKGE